MAGRIQSCVLPLRRKQWKQAVEDQRDNHTMKAQKKASIKASILLLLLLTVFGNSYAASNKEE